ncbi:TPA: hypothetical protein R4Y39_001195 [Raoultella planticola]|nr:hypothetical protein [Raoultella planticola]
MSLVYSFHQQLEADDVASVSKPFSEPLSMWLALRAALHDATCRDGSAANKQA